MLIRGANLEEIVGRIMSWPSVIDKNESIIEAGAKVLQHHARENVEEDLYRESTGFLADEIKVVISSPRKAEVGTRPGRVPYARIHEFGGVIRPKKAKALFVPLRRGVVAGMPGLVHGVDFVLAKKVTIPQRSYLRKALDENRPKILEAVGTELARRLIIG